MNIVYILTSNFVDKALPSMRSVLKHNPKAKIYLLTETDSVDIDIPVTVVNVSGQQYFPPSGPNYQSKWTYMVLMRTALCYLFPDLDRVLVLDCDTLVNKPIDLLWSVDITGYYYAMVEEKQITNRDHPYFNFGVTIHNLAQLRDGTADTIIRTINSVYLPYCEQDAVNSVCKRRILELPQEYNATFFNIPRIPDGEEIIKHYAAWHPFDNKPGYKQYDAMSWSDVLRKKRQVKHT